MKYTSQNSFDKTVDGKMALYRECCFPNCTKSWWKKLLSYVLEGRSPQSPSLGSAPVRNLGQLMQWSVTHDDVSSIVTSPVRYHVLCNLCYEPWSRKRWFQSSKYWIYFWNQLKILPSFNMQKSTPWKLKFPPNLLNHKIAPTTHKIIPVEDHLNFKWIWFTKTFFLFSSLLVASSYIK